jgi:hypothetical protein
VVRRYLAGLRRTRSRWCLTINPSGLAKKSRTFADDGSGPFARAVSLMVAFRSDQGGHDLDRSLLAASPSEPPTAQRGECNAPILTWGMRECNRCAGMAQVVRRSLAGSGVRGGPEPHWRFRCCRQFEKCELLLTNHRIACGARSDAVAVTTLADGHRIALWLTLTTARIKTASSA